MRAEVQKRVKLETCNTCSTCALTKTGKFLCRIHLGELPTLSSLYCHLCSKTSVFWSYYSNGQTPLGVQFHHSYTVSKFEEGSQKGKYSTSSLNVVSRFFET